VAEALEGQRVAVLALEEREEAETVVAILGPVRLGQQTQVEVEVEVEQTTAEDLQVDLAL
jgi:pantothenate kinase